MDLGSILFIVAILAGVSVFVTRPFWQDERTSKTTGRYAVDTQDDHRASELMAAKEHSLATLADLENDYAQGKIPEEDYLVQREVMRAAAIEAMRQYDIVQSRAAEVTEHKGKKGQRLITPGEDPVEALITERRKGRKGLVSGFCPKCGVPYTKSDKFCANCGATL
jgi:hypothetical protein